MKPTSLLLLIALTLTASAEMKCAPGKCGSATAPAAKPLPKVPAKPQTDTTSKTEAHPAKAKRRTKPTIEQLFNVRTVKVKRMPTAKTQANYGYIVSDERRRVEVVRGLRALSKSSMPIPATRRSTRVIRLPKSTHRRSTKPSRTTSTPSATMPSAPHPVCCAVQKRS